MSRARARVLLTHYFAQPVARLLLALPITPNAITFLGLLISLGAAYLLATAHFLAGGALLLVGGAFDMLDGTLARLSGRATPSGAFLDSVTDRVAEAAVLFGLLWHFTGEPDRAGALLVYLALASSVLVSYLRARGEGLGVSSEAGIMTRPERIVVLSVGIMLGYPVITLGIVATLSFVTAAQRMAYIWKHIRSR